MADEPVSIVEKWRRTPATKLDVFMVNMSNALATYRQDTTNRHLNEYVFGYINSKKADLLSLPQIQDPSHIGSARFAYFPKSDSFLAEYSIFVSWLHPIMMSDIDEPGEQLRLDLSEKMLRDACQRTCCMVVLAAADACPGGDTSVQEIELFAENILSKTTVEITWEVPAAPVNSTDEITLPWRLRQKNVACRQYLATSPIEVRNSSPREPHVVGIEFDSDDSHEKWLQGRVLRDRAGNATPVK
jgi:hypothetical protein